MIVYMKRILHYSIADTSFGEIMIVWEKLESPKIQRIILPNMTKPLDSHHYTTSYEDRMS